LITIVTKTDQLSSYSQAQQMTEGYIQSIIGLMIIPGFELTSFCVLQRNARPI